MNDVSTVPAVVPGAAETGAASPSVMVVNHPLVQHKVTLARSEETTTTSAAWCAKSASF